MSTKSSQSRSAEFRSRHEAATDDETERFLADHHQEVEAKLQNARASIARGEAAPLEPLPVILRAARKRDKAR